MNVRERIATLMEDTQMRTQTCLSVQAWVVALALLDAYSASCPQAVLYAALTGVELDIAQDILTALDEANVLDQVLRHGLDEALADCRAHLAVFNLGIQPASEEEGYRLFRLSLA